MSEEGSSDFSSENLILHENVGDTKIDQTRNNDNLEFRREIENVESEENITGDVDLIRDSSINEINPESRSIEEIMILDPNHPLMVRFQNQLYLHLVRQKEKCQLETAVLDEQLKKSREQREEIGVRLYERQQDLAMLQAQLEELMEKLANKSLVNETTIYSIQQQQQMTQALIEKERQEAIIVENLLKEADDLSLKLFYIERAQAYQKEDMSLIERIVDKARKEATNHQEDKQTQDFFLNRMSEEGARIEVQIKGLKAKLSAQKTEKEAARDILGDAEVEIQKAHMDRVEILKQWNSALLGLRNRNEIYSQMLDSINGVKQNILTCQQEIHHSKKITEKEQVKNEQLGHVLHRIQVMVANTNKQLNLEQSRYECLKVEYTTYSSMLQETEKGLNKCNFDLQQDKKSYESLFEVTEKAYLARFEMEDKIKRKIHERMSINKAAKYSKKISTKLSDQIHELESEIAKIDNRIAGKTIDKFDLEAAILVTHKKLDDLEKVITSLNNDINLSETQINRRVRVIERKQQTIQLLNKNLESLIEQSGGLELSPIERQLHHYKVDIKAKEEDIKAMQNSWIRNQNHLVNLSQVNEGEKEQIDYFRKQFTVLSKKKIRIERNIENEMREIALVERNVFHMQGDIEKLNAMVCDRRKSEEELFTNIILKENNFVKQLKEAENEAVEMEKKLEILKQVKENTFRDFVESEKQVLLWEKRNKLTKETKETVKHDVDHGEIKAMRCEIHRMEVILRHLKRKQEILIQETEKAVLRRETIWIKGEIVGRDKMDVNFTVKKINEMKRKSKELKQELKTKLEEESKMEEEIKNTKSQINRKELRQIQESTEIAMNKIDEFAVDKDQISSTLLKLQKRGKNYESVFVGKYRRRIKSASNLENDYEREVERRDKLIAFADSLLKEYPHLSPRLSVINKLTKIL